MTGQYSIEIRQLTIAGLVAHDFVVVRNLSTNQIVTEIHGLATDSSGNVNAIGTKNPFSSDKIKVYAYGELPSNTSVSPDSLIYNPPETYFNGTYNQSPYLVDGQPSQIIFSGTYEEVFSRISYAIKGGNYINSLNISYPFLGFLGLTNTNSNAVNYTLGDAMGLTIPGFWRWEPGQGINLIPKDEWYDQSLGLKYGTVNDNDAEYFLEFKNYANYDPEADNPSYEIHIEQLNNEFTLGDGLENLAVSAKEVVWHSINGTTLAGRGL